jgi:hypothetical protein
LALPANPGERSAGRRQLPSRLGEQHHRAFTLVVLGTQDGQLTEMATVARPELFAAFGLPSTQP